MAKFAVGYLTSFENALSVKVVEAADWRSALGAAHPDHENYVTSNDMEYAKGEAANQDWYFDVVLVE
ncbi:hypothetical protein [Sphingobium sp. CFD-1]|uniref:hypothetical protein n=1 Tax=Sphingobium sp. CFD-1 TaxID=2878545 RepID=UPI00214C6C67|nr:hypothetical protein [Sphingobium sp. CFD-1]